MNAHITKRKALKRIQGRLSGIKSLESAYVKGFNDSTDAVDIKGKEIILYMTQKKSNKL